MKVADNCFRWNLVVTLIDGCVVDLIEFYGNIYDLRDILKKHDLQISDSTLYGMKKIQDREYLAVPLKAVDIAPAYQEKLGINGENVAEWHLKMGRKR